MTWRTLVAQYEEGKLVLGELTWRLFTVLDDDNIAEFLDEAPPPIIDLLMRVLPYQPNDDASWDNVLIGGSNWSHTDTKNVIPFWRKGVEALRRHCEVRSECGQSILIGRGSNDTTRS